MFKRYLQIRGPEKQSFFLWGARQTGKSHYLKQHYASAIYYDLLDSQERNRLARSPHLLREEVTQLTSKQLALPVIIDEVEKVPELLNEVHWLIENTEASFILCGSSARKLKTQSTNLLGGRAWPYHFYPLTFVEIPAFDLLKALQQGLLPKHYLAEKKYINDFLKAYVDVYLTDEIRNEGLVRNLPAFAQFLELAGMTNADMINMSNIARDCGVDRSTVKEYYQILIDTLLGYFVYPFRKKIKRDIILATPKFYLFDVAVANYLGKRKVIDLMGDIAGRSFEHYIFMELMAYRGLNREQWTITYWRTKTGLEVDFILGENAEVALEIKVSRQVHKKDIKGLIEFCQEHKPKKAIVVSQDLRARKLQLDDGVEITILPWQDFLKLLWQKEII